KAGISCVQEISGSNNQIREKGNQAVYNSYYTDNLIITSGNVEKLPSSGGFDAAYGINDLITELPRIISQHGLHRCSTLLCLDCHAGQIPSDLFNFYTLKGKCAYILHHFVKCFPVFFIQALFILEVLSFQGIPEVLGVCGHGSSLQSENLVDGRGNLSPVGKKFFQISGSFGGERIIFS